MKYKEVLVGQIRNDPNDRDVWFSFRPDKTSMLIRVFGSGSFAGKTMVKPQFALYTGTCGNLIYEGCSSELTGVNYIEFLVSDVVIGRKYFLRIAARDGGAVHSDCVSIPFHS
ncbi:MAG: hypothetical protein IPL23_18685 [Saprospiraceae bacterium]|nr:hypothetical protein [Saprospiraceae bacterium]